MPITNVTTGKPIEGVKVEIWGCTGFTGSNRNVKKWHAPILVWRVFTDGNRTCFLKGSAVSHILVGPGEVLELPELMYSKLEMKELKVSYPVWKAKLRRNPHGRPKQ